MTLKHCPNCGYALTRPGRLHRWAGAWKERHTTLMQSTALAPWEPAAAAPRPGGSFEATRQTPSRPQNLESDFLTPLAQATATGFFVAAGGVYLGALVDGLWWYHGVGAGILAGGIYWLVAMKINRALLWVIEEISQQDINQDGNIGQPEPDPAPLSLEVVHKDEEGQFNRMLRFDLPAGIGQADVINFAKGVVIERRGLAESSWIGRGKPFSRGKYQALLDALTAGGIVRWIDEANHAAGRELTGAGRRSLLQLAYSVQNGSHTHSRSPDGGYESEDLAMGRGGYNNVH